MTSSPKSYLSYSPTYQYQRVRQQRQVWFIELLILSREEWIPNVYVICTSLSFSHLKAKVQFLSKHTCLCLRMWPRTCRGFQKTFSMEHLHWWYHSEIRPFRFSLTAVNRTVSYFLHLDFIWTGNDFMFEIKCLPG